MIVLNWYPCRCLTHKRVSHQEVLVELQSTNCHVMYPRRASSHLCCVVCEPPKAKVDRPSSSDDVSHDIKISIPPPGMSLDSGDSLIVAIKSSSFTAMIRGLPTQEEGARAHLIVNPCRSSDPIICLQIKTFAAKGNIALAEFVFWVQRGCVWTCDNHMGCNCDGVKL